VVGTTVFRSVGSITVTNLAAGRYCVAVAGIDPSQAIAIVEPDFANDSSGSGNPGSNTMVEWDSNGGAVGCAPTEFGVLTFNQVGATVSAANEGFTFLVP
jgi:hypothetical protein